MTQTALTEISQRRHTDPPRLWISVFLGSVLIHLCGLGILSWLMVSQQPGEVGTASIPVELIAIRPESKIRSFAPPQVASNARIAGQKSATKSQKIRGKGQGTGKGKQGKSQTSPKTPLSPPKNTSKVLPRTKSVLPTPSPYSSNKPLPLPAPSPYPSNKPLPSPTKPAPSPYSSNKPSPSPTPPPSPKPSPSPQGNGLVATVFNVHLPSNASDLPDPNGEAKPLEFQKQIDTSHYMSPALGNLKQPLLVHVKLVITNTGKVESLSTGNSKTAPLALEILKDWKFKPATQGGMPVYTNLELDLRIAPPQIKTK